MELEQVTACGPVKYKKRKKKDIFPLACNTCSFLLWGNVIGEKCEVLKCASLPVQCLRDITLQCLLLLTVVKVYNE